MAKINRYYIQRIKDDVNNTSQSAVGRETKLGQSIVRRIYFGKESCGEGTLKRLIDYYGKPPPDASTAGNQPNKEKVYPGINLPPRRFLLSVNYPEKRFKAQLQLTKTLSMMGTNLRRHDGRREVIENFLFDGGAIQALLIDPRSAACKYAAFQEHGNIKPQSISVFVHHVTNSYEWLCELKTREDNKYFDKVEIWKIGYPLCYGIDAMEFQEEGRGVAYIRFYPLMVRETEKDRPIIEVSDDDKDWYSFFTRQLDRHFSRAEPWKCARKRPENKQSAEDR